MISIRRKISIFLVIIVILTKYECRGQSKEDAPKTLSSYDDSDKIVSTYRTNSEKQLQYLLGVFFGDPTTTTTSPTSESSKDRETIDGVEDFIHKLIRKPVPKIQPSYNTTAKSFGEVLNLVEGPFHAYYPETMWCGGGDIASSGDKNTDLFEKTNSCCREHDKCPTIIEAGKSSPPLLNNGAFTRSICTCERAFYTCLKDVNSPLSIKIGTTYFNVLKPQCFAPRYSINGCEEYGRYWPLLKHRCRKYRFDKSQPKKLTWIDNFDF